MQDSAFGAFILLGWVSFLFIGFSIGRLYEQSKQQELKWQQCSTNELYEIQNSNRIAR